MDDQDRKKLITASEKLEAALKAFLTSLQEVCSGKGALAEEGYVPMAARVYFLLDDMVDVIRLQSKILKEEETHEKE